MPKFTASDISALEVVNNLKSVLIPIPNKLQVVSPETITIKYNYLTGALEYDITEVKPVATA